VHLLLNNTFGLVEKVLIAPGPANAPRPKPGQTATVHATVTLNTGGKPFFSTRDKYGKAFTFSVGSKKVIKGWDIGVQAMQLGEKAKVTVSPCFGYGVEGFPPWNVPGNATLVLDLELLKIDAAK